ncbi:MAG: selenium metabolism-associated LysR family transcriptional regulator [Desulfonatronovibrionaceae bacterium]
MDLRKLQAFASVYKLQSFSRASREMFLSQPTVSTHVQSLEQELGVKLFDRVGRVVIPTKAGQILYSGVKDIFQSLEKVRENINELNNRIQGNVTVGSSTIPSLYLLPDFLRIFKTLHPGVQVELQIRDSIGICREVLAGRLDLGVVGGFAEHFDLEHIHLTSDRLFVVHSPLIKADQNKAGDVDYIKGLPWIMREKGSGTRQAMERALQNMGIEVKDLNVCLTVYSNEALVKCVTAGLGLGMTSGLAVSLELESGQLRAYQIPGLDIKRDFHLVRHRRRSMFACGRRFMEVLAGHFKQPDN